MTFEDALAELELDSIPDAVTARRAYLRAVKAHPPERDADGFRRVREAYERLMAELPFRLADLARKLEPIAGPVPELRELAPAAAEPVADAPEIAVHAEIERIHDELEAGSKAAIVASRALVSAHPRSEAARWNLIEMLDDAEQDREAELAMVQAQRDGLDGFLTPCLNRCPKRLSEADVKRGALADNPLTRAAAARAFFVRREPVRAGKLYAELLTRAAQAEGPALDASYAMYTLAELIATNKPNTAKLLERALRTYIAELSVRRGPIFNAARWLLFEELLSLRGRIEPELFVALAAALSGPDIDPTHYDVVLYRSAHPKSAEKMRRLLQKDAPNLFRLFGAALAKPPRAPVIAPVGGRVVAWPFIVAVMIAMNGARVCASSPTTPVSTHERYLSTLVDLTTQRSDPILRENAAVLQAAVARGDCSSLPRALDNLRASARGRHGAALADAAMRVERVCGAGAGDAAQEGVTP